MITDFSLIRPLILILFGLASISVGVGIIRKTTGGLRKSVIYLIIAVFIIAIKGLIKILAYFFFIPYTLEIYEYSCLLVIFFILLAAISMKKLIVDINNHNSKK